MAYSFYLGNMLCPVAPSSVSIKIKNQNKTINLINDTEINILKKPGLSEITFDLLLPNVRYPFAVYKDGFVNAKVFLDELEDLKVNKQTFQFIVNRELPSGKVLFDTNMKVSLESYEIREDKEDGFDVVVSVTLLQYRDYGTKVCTIKKKPNKKPTATVNKKRPAKKTNKTKTHKVRKGDCLWNIAKKYYGDGSKWKVIYNANKGKIKNPNMIYDNQVLTIPAVK